jgi:antitoxin component YwqK of YwqJK toxin-antitoxin module
MYNENGRITPVYKWLSLFNFLLQRKDDKKNQLKYITKYMDNKNLQKNYKELTKTAKKYDIPHLISEKETLIQSLEDENAKSFWGIEV